MPETLLTVDEAAERLQMHPDTLRRHLRRGEIRAIKRGPRLWRIPESALNAPNIQPSAEPREPPANIYPPASVGAHLPEVPPLDLSAYFMPPTPAEIARRLAALETLGEGHAPEEGNARELDLIGDRATLYGYEAPEDDPVRHDRDERAARLMEGHR